LKELLASVNSLRKDVDDLMAKDEVTPRKIDAMATMREMKFIMSTIAIL